MLNPLTNGNTWLAPIYNQSSPKHSRKTGSGSCFPQSNILSRLSVSTTMSRPILSTAARRLSRSHSPRAAVSAFSPALSFSASFCDSVSQRSTLRPSFLCPRASSSQRSVFRFDAFGHRAAFSSSTIRSDAKVLQNPRVDEDGKELLISISSRAAERLREITDPTSSPSITKEENPYHHLRITVTSGGCHGFQYMMSLEASSKIDPEEDTVFAAEDAESAGPGEAKVVMDEPSLELLSGSTVDYTMELIGSQFKIVDNPRATSNCGCGTSFDVKD
ncbi:hypothetical protein BO78DRAFT_370107 [Aspergillus sclerotiicarbonarius CBS 121057]|uniref:Core domain-containing protein n=1 Tax=Aspergillus sclerotiicarbonarius (strain CBS 121057 / IBT 28362) TaxID=1448318 RepID=A0A319E6X7_ASPSB|nr:hypothetical protein BO78DRAFT_370107 [Aspergillus sclerotiicarbonarius CBS 121057]